MPKQITLELPEWVNWIAQDNCYNITLYENDPTISEYFKSFCVNGGNWKTIFQTFEASLLENWRESKINLNTDKCYIDEDGILRKVEGI